MGRWGGENHRVWDSFGGDGTVLTLVVVMVAQL